ncbi:MAG TPA: dienelactone hydrolase family protein [Rubrivivax sp.]|nr:dienelactone hydrolase family protein [Burkholderiales bacterium]HNU11786.1 dienelactone hydrolase family protein [Rubrivivax sp.]
MIQQDLDSLVPARDFSRRGFMRTSVGSGFAAAVLPVVAQTQVRTSADGLVAGEVTIPVGDFRMPAYRAAPAAKADAPLVLVVSEIFGVHEYIGDVARRLAHAGCFAVAPELFVRQGDAKSYREIARLMSEVIAKVPDAQVMQDLDACVAWARAQGADAARLGITGFCWGGRVTWLYAAHNPALKAGVAWYGRLSGQGSALAPKNPIDLVGAIKAPILGLYGGADAGIPVESVEQMRKALREAGNTASEIVLYPDAPHAFHADYRPSYRQAAAEDGWKRLQAWFARYLA